MGAMALVGGDVDNKGGRSVFRGISNPKQDIIGSITFVV